MVGDAFGRGYSQRRSECGARGREDTARPRAASGIMLAGTTTGPGGAFSGLGQAGAGNARGRTRGLRPPVGASVTRQGALAGSQETWPGADAERARAPTVRAVVERRKASALRFQRAPRPLPRFRASGSEEDKARRLEVRACRRSASCLFSSFLFVAWVERSETRERLSSSFDRPRISLRSIRATLCVAPDRDEAGPPLPDWSDEDRICGGILRLAW